MKNAVTKDHFINRELSWLDFNGRVLDQAFDMGNPLLERLKFIAIFSNNLDEFFMVRVAGLRHQQDAGSTQRDPSGLNPTEQLDAIRSKVRMLVRRQYNCLHGKILPELKAKGARLVKPADLDISERDRLRVYFEDDIMPVLTPIGVDPSHPFPSLNNRAIEILVRLRKSVDRKPHNAFVEVPQVLPQFIEVSAGQDAGDGKAFITLEDLVLEHISLLFVGCEILASFPFRITKDMDFSIDEEGAADLLVSLERQLMTTKRRQAVRLEVIDDAKGAPLNWLVKQLGIGQDCVFPVSGPLDLSRFFEFIGKLGRPDLADEKLLPVEVPVLADNRPVLDVIKRWRVLPLFHPFESFKPVVRFLEEAAEDPDVLAIKQTLYRVSGDSPIVRALRHAAENGKQVTVIVEIKARFDESRNIKWAKKLEESGAHVIYGVAGLKIHSKALLIVRREEGLIKRYVHLSTGNYNDSTAKLYTDIGVFCADPEICADVSAMFNVITGYSEPPPWNKLAVAPFNLRETFIRLIDREARLSSPRAPGHIIAKMNSLVDPVIIERLYHAAYAGVKIDLIVRGICCLKPGKDTKNIRVVSIVDRYLEHTRVYYFANGGAPEYYLASADWMQRNLDRRVELLFPIEDDYTRGIIQATLDSQLRDVRKGRFLNAHGNYYKRECKSDSTRSQIQTYRLLTDLLRAEEPKRKLTVLKKVPE